LIEVLRRRYRDHWFPEKPCKGSGYRCIRINGKIDPIIAQAAEIVGMPTNTIHQTFPSELTMWIDPLEVSYRIGENGSICILYEYKENQQGGTGGGNAPQPWRPAPVPTTSRSKTSSPTTLKSSTRSTATSQQQSNTSVSSSPVKQLQQSNQVSILPKSTPSSPKHHSSNLNNVNNLNHLNSSQQKSSACKDSLYKIDFLIDPRKSASISEHLAAYVSS